MTLLRRQQSEIGFLFALLLYFLTIIILGSSAFSQTEKESSRIWLTTAELLRISNGQLYLWSDCEVPVNTDFTIEITPSDGIAATCRVADAPGGIVISEPLPDSIIVTIKLAANLNISVYLDRGKLSPDTLFVGIPVTMKEALIDDESAATADTLNRRAYRYYRNLAEAQIDLAVGRLQLLLLPETEVDSDTKCRYDIYPTADLIEWFLLIDLPDYDLYPAALSYCLKGFLTAGEGRPASCIIAPRHLEQFFGRYPPHAASLFSQMRTDAAERKCRFNGMAMFPGLTARCEREVQQCGGKLILVDGNDAAKINLGFILYNDDATAAKLTSSLAQFLEQVAQAEVSWYEALPDSLPQDHQPVSRDLLILDEGTSRMLSEKIRVVPLGMTRLVIVARPEVRCLAEPDAAVTVSDFYLMKNE
ncbi:MAG: hypothetical protein KAT58_04875 [candidate division Zixibacteria bacterium]|nr:hypothetical protein [candidate division Zixibacteria bacterium]